VNVPDFIEVYPDALARDACSAMIEHFERSGQAQPGVTGSGLRPKLKDSSDIVITGRPEWQADHQVLLDATLECVAKYVQKFRHVILAPLTLELADRSTGERRVIDGDAVARMSPAAIHRLVTTAFRPGSIQLQKYIADRGGYPYWHSEHYPQVGTTDPLHRVLLVTIYLNDGFREGETEFLYQQRAITPRTGSVLIAPASFTHTHRGNRPREADKYIATSWILFQPAERLYGAGEPSR
jgi:hypothetical protein